MDGKLMYEIAKQRMADHQRVARQAMEAKEARSQRTARGRRAKAEAADAVGTPVIPDFADEMFAVARDLVPAPRGEARRRRARPGR